MFSIGSSVCVVHFCTATIDNIYKQENVDNLLIKLIITKAHTSPGALHTLLPKAEP